MLLSHLQAIPCPHTSMYIIFVFVIAHHVMQCYAKRCYAVLCYQFRSYGMDSNHNRNWSFETPFTLETLYHINPT